jgi:hypothetical protein
VPIFADFVAIRFRGEFTCLRSGCAGRLRDPGNIARVAVVAIHPTDDSIPFTQNLLDALSTNNFYILAVHNKPCQWSSGKLFCLIVII